MQTAEAAEVRRGEESLSWWELPPFSGSSQSAPLDAGAEDVDSRSADSKGLESMAAESDESDRPRIAPVGLLVEELDQEPPQIQLPGSENDSPAEMAMESFLRVLSAVAAPAPATVFGEGEFENGDAAENAQAAPAWSGSGFEEEAAPAASPDALDDSQEEADSISYEGALRRGARLSTAGEPCAEPRMPRAVSESSADRGFAPAQGRPVGAADAAKRLSSITIRLSHGECAQLKQRAAEAGVTLSAYVRSCVFEAESLRAQVRQAIKELRGEPRGQSRVDFPDEAHGESRTPAQGAKKPPASELPLPPIHSPLHSNDLRRHWWQLRPHGKNFAAQA